MPCPLSHSSRRGTRACARGDPGLLMIPTASMTRMQQELLISFRAQHRTRDHACPVSKRLDGFAYFTTGRLMQRRISHNAAFPDMFSSNFKLRLNQNEQLAVRLQQGGK